MRFNVTASNLTDKRYVASCDTVSACFYGTGRTVLGTLSYAW
jgi:iron complex outermembrane receptor protein